VLRAGRWLVPPAERVPCGLAGAPCRDPAAGGLTRFSSCSPATITPPGPKKALDVTKNYTGAGVTCVEGPLTCANRGLNACRTVRE
jgi:hypothetical protein